MNATTALGAAPPAYTIQSRTVTMPVVVRDATSMTAIFVVSAEAARRLIPDPRLQLPELWPGRALCIISGIAYRDNDLGQYNEVSIAFFVRFGGQRPLPLFGLLSGFARHTLGAYIHRLPVTTSFSCEAGRDIWGFPKSVEQIDFVDEGPQRRCQLVVEGTQVLALSMRRGGRRQMKEVPQDAYAWRDGVLWRTPSMMGGAGVGARLGGATLTLGAHPIADELRVLGLPRHALVSTWVEHMHARFDAPQRLL